jgi:hypothetical protein
MRGTEVGEEYCMGGRGGIIGEKGFSFFDLWDFTLRDFSLEHKCRINRGVLYLHI